MSEQRGRDRAGGRAKTLLTPLQNLAAVGAPGGDDGRGRRRPSGGPVHDHADTDGSQGGALAALAESRPAVKARQRDVELEAARAEIAWLSAALTQMAVKLTLVEGKDGWG
jgi:transposase